MGMAVELGTGNSQEDLRLHQVFIFMRLNFLKSRSIIDTYDDSGDVQGSLKNDFFIQTVSTIIKNLRNKNITVNLR